MLESLHLKLSEQITFIWKNKVTKLIYFNRCPSQPAGSRTTDTWVVATSRSTLCENICHYLHLTEVYINYIFARRQPTVRLPEKQSHNGLLHKDLKN